MSTAVTGTVNPTDGSAAAQSASDWTGARDQTDASLGVINAFTETEFAANVAFNSSRGSSLWTCRRYQGAFDTSQISASFSVTSAKITLLGHSIPSGYTLGDVIVIKSNKPDLSTGVATTDFDDLPGFSSGNTMDGNVTNYSAAFPSGSQSTDTSTFYDIPLNTTAIADIRSDDVFKFAIVNYNYDYLNADPQSGGVQEALGLFLGDNSDTNKRPALVVEYGYGNKVLGVEAANIARISAVDKKRVKKVFGRERSS